MCISKAAEKITPDGFDTAHQSAGSTGSTFRSATVEVRAPDFQASNLTFANDFNRTHEQTAQGSQVLALLVNGDRGVFRNVRLLGNQDTLYAASANCNPDGNPCAPARQHFADCHIEGNVDFIFGNGKAFFDRCEIPARPTRADTLRRRASTTPMKTPALFSGTAH